jgi:phosphatidylglycerophosphate synthase
MADRLTKSILATIAAYFFAQAAIYAAFALVGGFFGYASRTIPFFTTAAAFHLFLLALLLLFKQDFVKESSGVQLERVNLANRITLFRVSTLPTLLFLVIAARDYRIRVPLLVLVILVFATDFFDGYVSRKAGEVTRVGRMMDSASDYSLIIVLTIVFYYFHLIPRWIFIAVVARLGLQVFLMAVLILVKRKIDPKTTLMGKAAVAGIMVLYATEILRLLFAIHARPVFMGVEYAVGAIVIASMGDKLILFIKDMRVPRN